MTVGSPANLMKQQDRFNLILDALTTFTSEHHMQPTVGQLTDYLQWPSATVGRNLDFMEARNLIERIHESTTLVYVRRKQRGAAD